MKTNEKCTKMKHGQHASSVGLIFDLFRVVFDNELVYYALDTYSGAFQQGFIIFQLFSFAFSRQISSHRITKSQEKNLLKNELKNIF